MHFCFLLSFSELVLTPSFNSQTNKRFDQELNSACRKLKMEFPELTNKYFWVDHNAFLLYFFPNF